MLTSPPRSVPVGKDAPRFVWARSMGRRVLTVVVGLPRPFVGKPCTPPTLDA